MAAAVDPIGQNHVAGHSVVDGSAPPRPPEDGKVILLSIDSRRADMPWNGYSRPT